MKLVVWSWGLCEVACNNNPSVWVLGDTRQDVVKKLVTGCCGEIFKVDVADVEELFVSLGQGHGWLQ